MAKEDKKIEAFVLCDCVFGKALDIVMLDKADAEVGQKAGVLDLHAEAIKAAKENK